MIASLCVAKQLDTDGGLEDVEIKVELRGRKLHLLQALRAERGEAGGYKKDGVYVPDKSAENPHKGLDLYEILAVSDDCRYFTKSDVGRFVALPGLVLTGRRQVLWRAGWEKVVSECLFEQAGIPLATIEVTR